jgi:hypothetical protein
MRGIRAFGAKRVFHHVFVHAGRFLRDGKTGVAQHGGARRAG